MSYCSRCGAEIDPGSAYCKACGAPVTEVTHEAPQVLPPPKPPPEQAFRVTPPRPPESVPSQPPSAGAPSDEPIPAASVPSYASPEKGGGAKALIFLLLGLAVVGAVVVLLLGFAVGPKWFVGGEGPEKTVEKFFQAMEKSDAKTLVSLIEPTQLKRLEKEIADYYESAEELFREYYKETFPEGDLKITGLKFESEVKGDTARVEVVSGKATYTDSYGDRITVSVDDHEGVFGETQFNLKKVDGNWYLMPEFE